jgi:MFS family permease
MFGGEGMDVFDFLSLWRFVLGVGAGAIYPIAAVLSAESEEEEDDGLGETEKEARKVQMIAITFSTQGVGFLAVPALAYPLMLIVGEEGLDLVWRLILGIGALPGVILVLLRCCTGRRRRLRGQLVPLSEPLGNGNNGEVDRAEDTCWDALMHSEIEEEVDTDSRRTAAALGNTPIHQIGTKSLTEAAWHCWDMVSF